MLKINGFAMDFHFNFKDSISFDMRKLVPPAIDKNANIALIDYGVHNFHITPTKLNHYVLPHSTFHIVLDGKGYYKTNEKTYLLNKGDSFYTPPNTEIKYYPYRNNPWTYFFYTINGKNTPLLFNSIGYNTLRPIYHLGDNAQRIVDIIEDSLTPHNQPNTSAFYFDALSRLYRILALIAEERPKLFVDMNTNYIPSKIKEVVESNLHDPEFHIPQLCNILNFSQSYLYQLCKRFFHCSLQQYITNSKMEKAKKMLAETTIKIKDVALSVGYTDWIQFSKIFKKNVGITPFDYRKRHTSIKK